MVDNVELESRAKKSRGTGKDPKLPRLSGRQRHASKSAFNHKVKKGYRAKSYGEKASNEVAMKATGAGKTAAGIKNGIDYITRSGELDAYCYDGLGEESTGKGTEFNREITETMSENNDYSKKYRGENVAHVKNFVFSPPPIAGVNRDDALKSAIDNFKKLYPDHAFVATYHDDKVDHPHVHINFKLRNERTGHRVDLKKADLKNLRNGFYRELANMGYDVAATYKYSPERKREMERQQAESPKRMRNVYKIVDFGETNYQNKPGEKRTPFIIYEQLNSGERSTIWGKNLKPHFEDEKLAKGDLVKIKKLKPTMVRTPMFNEDGSVSGYRESKLNNWQIENLGVDRERNVEAPKQEIVKQLDEQGVKQQLERKQEQKHNIGLTVEHGFLKDSPEHKKFKQEHDKGFKLGF